MNCKRCGNPLPSEGAVCKFCGAALTPEGLQYQRRINENKDKQITLMSEKYGQHHNIKYNEVKENKLMGIIIIAIILVILVILAILLNK